MSPTLTEPNLIMFEIVFLVLFAYALRIAPHYILRQSAGVDQWFWRAYIGKLRSDRKFPPELPQFLLDVAQWYPPLFPVLLARLPTGAFERHAHRFAVLIDVARLVLLCAAVRWLSGSNQAVLIAGLAYAITPVLISYNMQLNPRGLGALFLDMVWLAVAGLIFFDAPNLMWVAACGLGGLILLTHKMTTQLFVFTAISGAVIASDVRLALLVPGSIIAALILSAGFYRRVFQAHSDIVSFWYRNWQWSGSHPVLESPVYGEPGYESPGKYYRLGFRAWLRRLQFVVGFNPWVPAVLGVLVVALFTGYNFTSLEKWVAGWLALTFTFALITTLVPALRCFGQGYLYGYNGSFPAALTLGLTSVSLASTWTWRIIALGSVLACVTALVAYFRALGSSRTAKVDSHLDAAVRHLARLPKGAVMCLPQHWHDLVAFRTGHPVVFGGHGFGFRRLDPVFPRLLEKIQDIVATYNVRYLLTYRGYCNSRFLADLPPATVTEFGDYQLYRFALHSIDDAGPSP